MKASDSISGVMLGHSYQILMPQIHKNARFGVDFYSLIKWVLANKNDHALLLKCCKTLLWCIS